MALDALGLQKTSLTDFPGTVAAILFTHGCNMSCGWCHNGVLVNGPRPADFLPRREILDFLESRKKLLGGVVITGGEPLLHDDLPELIQEIRALGFKVKLDTNGSFPDRIESVEVDYIAMDLKLPPKNYRRVGFLGDPNRIIRSVEILHQGKTNHEFRLIWVSGRSRTEDVPAMASVLGSGARLFVAGFRPGTCLDPAYNASPPPHKKTLTEVVDGPVLAQVKRRKKAGCMTQPRPRFWESPRGRGTADAQTR